MKGCKWRQVSRMIPPIGADGKRLYRRGARKAPAAPRGTENAAGEVASSPLGALYAQHRGRAGIAACACEVLMTDIRPRTYPSILCSTRFTVTACHLPPAGIANLVR
jgi:hypothetical protein